MSVALRKLVEDSALKPAVKRVASVLASYGNDDGTRIHPAIERVAWTLGITERAVQAQMAVLRAGDRPILELQRPATQHYPAVYRLIAARLPQRPAYQPQSAALDLEIPLETPSETSVSGVKPTSPLNARGEAHFTSARGEENVPGVKPTSPDPSVRSVSTHTRTARAREAELPGLVGAVPRRERFHEAHAWCGRVCVPKFLHSEFRKRLGGPVKLRGRRLRAFYAETIAGIPSTQPIGDEPVRFWRTQFAAAQFSGNAATPARDDVWTAVLSALETRVNRYTWHTWFKGTKLVKARQGVLTIAAPSPEHGPWISKHLSDPLAAAIAAAAPGCRVEFVTKVAGVDEARRTARR